MAPSPHNRRRRYRPPSVVPTRRSSPAGPPSSPDVPALPVVAAPSVMADSLTRRSPPRCRRSPAAAEIGSGADPAVGAASASSGGSPGLELPGAASEEVARPDSGMLVGAEIAEKPRSPDADDVDGRRS